MIDWKAVIIGFLLSSILGLALNSFIPIIGGMISTLVAAILVGYLVNNSLMKGAINGALMGFLGGLVEIIIILILGYTFAGFKGLLIAGIGAIIIIALSLIHIVIAIIGGIIGSAIKNEY